MEALGEIQTFFFFCGFIQKYIVSMRVRTNKYKLKKNEASSVTTLAAWLGGQTHYFRYPWIDRAYHFSLIVHGAQAGVLFFASGLSIETT